jgi:hypothetical protein
MKTIQIVFLNLFLVVLFSCGKECEKKNSELTDTISLINLKPEGKFKSDAPLSKDNITFNSDSTAVLYYKNNDTTYEFTYKVQTYKTYVSSQKKFK